MTKEDLVEWILDNGKYITTVRDELHRVNLYQVKGDYWEIYFHIVFNKVTRVGRLSAIRMAKYVNKIKLPDVDGS